MSRRGNSANHAPSRQKLRNSQNAQPRHVPESSNFSGIFSHGPSYCREMDRSFAEPTYALRSVQSQFSSVGHTEDVPWTHDMYLDLPGGNASAVYPNDHGEYPPSYDASMAESRRNFSNDTVSMEYSSISPGPLPWTPNDAVLPTYSSTPDLMEDELTSHGLFDLSPDISFLPAQQSSESMPYASTFVSNGPYAYGNMSGLPPYGANNVHIHQCNAVGNHPSPWSQEQPNAGLVQQFPPTPPASDSGTPPHTHEFSSFSPQDLGQDAYDQYRSHLGQEGAQTSHVPYATVDVTSPYQTQSTTIKATSLVQRPIRSASDRKGSHDSRDPDAQPSEGNHISDAPPRSDPLYKAPKGSDGLWHCPFREEMNCGHEPTTQKCGYDKYLDSHIKPFECTFQDCASLNFSSNACLFRHQREAHGMHGHGENPHLCHYPGCDRSKLGNGFPRKWNLKDHMKRVHGWVESSDSPSAWSPPTVPHKPGQTARKRKGSPPFTSVAMKRQSSSQAKARAASVSHYQYSQQHDLFGAPENSTKGEWSRQGDYGFPSPEEFYKMSQAQYIRTGEYAQKFSQSQDHYTHGAEDRC